MIGSAPVPYDPMMTGQSLVPLHVTRSGPTQSQPRLNEMPSPGASVRFFSLPSVLKAEAGDVPAAESLPALQST